MGEAAACAGGRGEGAVVAGTTARETARSPSEVLVLDDIRSLYVSSRLEKSLLLSLCIYTWNICHTMHLKSARAILFIQERIVFLADLSPALPLLLKDKLGPSENKVEAAIFNRFALARIYTGQASPSPGPAACALGQRAVGSSLFFLLSAHFVLIYILKEIFLW